MDIDKKEIGRSTAKRKWSLPLNERPDLDTDFNKGLCQMAERAKPVNGGQKGEPANGSMRIDAKLVQELAELLAVNGLTEIEVADGERRIKVGRAAVGAAAAPQAQAPAALPSAAAPPAPLGIPEELAGETVKSPIVGTAFLSPQPGAEPFIRVGDAVKAGATLLIIEAMKVMNPITAPGGGVVKKIMVADAQPVEFDQPLVIIG
jgi:acetyl-CoA carboxylase biotin carboxyl carrier protein